MKGVEVSERDLVDAQKRVGEIASLVFYLLFVRKRRRRFVRRRLARRGCAVRKSEVGTEAHPDVRRADGHPAHRRARGIPHRRDSVATAAFGGVVGRRSGVRAFERRSRLRRTRLRAFTGFFFFAREKVWVRADDQVQRLELDGDGLGAEGVPRDDGAQARDPALQTRHGDDVSEFPSQIRPTKRGVPDLERSRAKRHVQLVRVQIEQSFPERAAQREREHAAQRPRVRAAEHRHRHARRRGGRASVRACCLPAGAASSRPPRLKDGTSADASHPPGSRVRRPRVHARGLSSPTRALDSRERGGRAARRTRSASDARQREWRRQVQESVLEIAGKSIL